MYLTAAARSATTRAATAAAAGAFGFTAEAALSTRCVFATNSFVASATALACAIRSLAATCVRFTCR